jgi:peptidoglycan/LPS O-acetylase OafA/YrhL
MNGDLRSQPADGSVSTIDPASAAGSIHQPTLNTRQKRLASLDSLRGIAALSVVFLHFTTDFHRDYTPNRISSFEWSYGNYGVHLFFLLSGFVILMTAEKSAGPYEFLVSRFSRLYPPYWAAIIFTTILLALSPIKGVPQLPHLLRRAAVNLTMVQNWLGVGSIDSVYWTLQVEISFYLVLLVLIWRKAIKNAILVMTALVIIALCDHLLVQRPWNPFYAQLRQLFILEPAYLFTAGMVLYKIREGFRLRYGITLLLCALCPATANYWPNHPAVDASVVIMLALLVHLASSGRVDWIANRLLLYIGGISYSLYLTHHWLGLVFLNHADEWGMNPNLALAVAIALCVLTASIMTYFIERPSLRWFRQVLFRSGRGSSQRTS